MKAAAAVTCLVMLASCGQGSTGAPSGPVHASQEADVDFRPPCAEPAGGWTVRNPATATQDRYDAAMRYALDQSEYAGAWIGWLDATPLTGNTIDGLHQVRASVLTASFTRNVDRHRKQIESVYGGAICVFERDKTVEELRKLAEEVAADLQRRGLHVTSYGADELRGTAMVGLAELPPGLVEQVRLRFGAFVELKVQQPFGF